MKSSTSTLATRKSISLAIGLILLMILAGACSSKSARLTRVTVAGETSMKAQPDAAIVVLSVITESPQALNAQQIRHFPTTRSIATLLQIRWRSRPGRRFLLPFSQRL